MIAMKERLPELIIVPAHDMRAFAVMPTLPPAGDGIATNGGTRGQEQRKDDGF
jgi:hypothetical protein